MSSPFFQEHNDKAEDSAPQATISSSALFGEFLRESQQQGHVGSPLWAGIIHGELMTCRKQVLTFDY
jgi:hypothetical protein